MSRVLSSPENLDGLIQRYEQEIGAEVGFVSGNTNRAKKFISATRSAWDKYLYLAFKGSGTWQYDDSNHADYPIIYTNIVSGQQDYTFTTDEQGNLILDIYKVAALKSATDTTYEELVPIDQQRHNSANSDITRESGATGAPYAYDKTANGFFLDVEPDYNATSGLKVWINREASYYSFSDISGDPTKKPGCPGIHHDYFWLRPAMEEAARQSLSTYADLRDRVKEFEGDERDGTVGLIENYFSKRIRDERPVMTMKRINYI